MGKIAFVFPGQGSQKVGMGRDIFEHSAAAAGVFKAADEALGMPLSKLCFEGPESELMLTVNTQPAVLTTSVALLEALEERCDVAAGHSLGEYSAHVAAGTLRFEDAVQLVRMRGGFMQEAVPVGAGAMGAVMGLDGERVAAICRAIDGVVEAVNFNSPGQVVIAGAADAVRAAGEKLQAEKAKFIPLSVSAPFHSSLMRPAEDRLRPHLEACDFRAPEVPVYVNVDAAPTREPDEARDALARQVSRAVCWEESVRRMIADGVTLFVEIGHGRVLSGLIGRIDRAIKRVNVQGPDDLEPARAAIAAER